MHVDPTAGLVTLHDCCESISNELFYDIQNPAHRLHSLLPHPISQCPVNLRRQHTNSYCSAAALQKSAPKFYLSPCDEPFLVE